MSYDDINAPKLSPMDRIIELVECYADRIDETRSGVDGDRLLGQAMRQDKALQKQFGCVAETIRKLTEHLTLFGQLYYSVPDITWSDESEFDRQRDEAQINRGDND